MTKISINQILIKDRLRLNKGDIESMKDSLLRVGQIHPVLLRTLNSDEVADGKTHQLVAGERRTLGAIAAGWTEIGYTTRESLTEAELHELELEENIRRKDMSWQERAISIAKIHKLKMSQKWAQGEAWGLRETGEMLGMGKSNVNVMVLMAKELESNPNSECWKAEQFSDAWRILMSRLLKPAEDALQKLTPPPSVGISVVEQNVLQLVDSVDNENDLSAEKERYYSNPHNPPNSFEAYWKEKVQHAETIRNTVYLSNQFFNIDCLSFMADNPNRFDHIVTDPPYGIDMDMLEQQNTGMVNIDSVRAEHDVESNLKLLIKFLPLAHYTLKDKGFLCLWCDTVYFEALRQLCEKVNFAVQRWPFIWVKSDFHSNQAAQYNMTKCTEIALIARKKGTLLTRNDIPNYVLSPSSDEITKKLLHPFAKPFAAWRHLIEAVSLPGQTVYDPFLGEGSGVLAALQLNRISFGTELVFSHYDRAIGWIKEFYLKQNSKTIFK